MLGSTQRNARLQIRLTRFIYIASQRTRKFLSFGLAIGWLKAYLTTITGREKASVTERPYRAPAAQQEGVHEFVHLSIACPTTVRAPLGF